MIYPISVLSSVTQRLSSVSESAALDAQVLLAAILGRPRSWVMAHPEARLTPQQEAALTEKLARLEKGEPLPYVLGRWEFYGLEFEVSSAALIPRPETELMVDVALNWLRSRSGGRLMVDVGAGTGCIAVALAVHDKNLRAIVVDISLEALRLAQRNIQRHALQERALCIQADLIPAAGVQYDLICANLPYIPTNTLRGLPIARWEPWQALDGGADGLQLIRRLLAQAPTAIKPGGLILLEIEASQGEAVQALAQAAFPHVEIELTQDLAGRDRLISIQT
ncbi:MAG: peptide chain release factor N(5)-glutamine methyltransferase [Anaerolineales bacterium]|nr:peptide chain release factor N(5)-glutamine methyltransferase [Anaerolineales bacterium]